MACWFASTIKAPSTVVIPEALAIVMFLLTLSVALPFPVNARTAPDAKATWSIPGIASSFCKSTLSDELATNVISPLKLIVSSPVPPFNVKEGSAVTNASTLMISFPTAASAVIDVSPAMAISMGKLVTAPPFKL